MEIQQLARLGAQVRFQEVQTEMSSLVKMFPDLNGHEPKKRGRPAKHMVVAAHVEPLKKRTMSRKARALISAAQKKRWAARHQTNGTKHAAAATAPTMRVSKKAKEVKDARGRSAALLALFNDTPHTVEDVIPVNMDAHGIGSLLRRGYLKRKKGGYTRTAKEFVI